VKIQADISFTSLGLNISQSSNGERTRGDQGQKETSEDSGLHLELLYELDIGTWIKECCRSLVDGWGTFRAVGYESISRTSLIIGLSQSGELPGAFYTPKIELLSQRVS
jgi:hypothetical protein